jgi:hypothetical protein
MATYTVDVKKEEFVFTPKIPESGVDTNDVFEFRHAGNNSTRTITVYKGENSSTELFDVASFDVISKHTSSNPLRKTVSSRVVGDTTYVISTEKQTDVIPDEAMTANIKVVKKSGSITDS